MDTLTKAAFLLICALTWASPCPAQVFQVEPIQSGMFSSSESTTTFLWPGRDAQAVLIMIPGGEGHLGITPDRTDLGGFYGATLKPLSDPVLTSGSLDVVVFDSPYRIPSEGSYPTARMESDHLSRVESVVRFYRDKLNKPIWLMGHSNGAVSITEFWKSIHDGDKRDLISGLVISSARNGISLPDDTAIPVLFLHHAKDGCTNASSSSSQAVYEDLKSAGRSRTNFVWITGGESEPQNPCHSGYHMFFGAGQEAAAAMDAFIAGEKGPRDKP